LSKTLHIGQYKSHTNTIAAPSEKGRVGVNLLTVEKFLQLRNSLLTVLDYTGLKVERSATVVLSQLPFFSIA